MKGSLATQQEESLAAKKINKVLEAKLVKANEEKEMYLMEVLKQKEKQCELLDSVNEVNNQANTTKKLLEAKEKEIEVARQSFEKEKQEFAKTRGQTLVDPSSFGSGRLEM